MVYIEDSVLYIGLFSINHTIEINRKNNFEKISKKC